MKGIFKNYSFDASAKTIQFNSVGTLYASNILLVVNLTRNAIIYNPFVSGKGGTVSGNTLTLDLDVTAYDDGDLLQIHYNFPDTIVQPRIPSRLLDRVVEDYPEIKFDYIDTFEKGDNHTWGGHIQANEALVRLYPNFSRVSKRGGSFAAWTDNAQSIETWLRKGEQGTLSIPTDAKKVIVGYEWTWRAWWLRGLYRIQFGADIQLGTLWRIFARLAWLRSSDGSTLTENAWQLSIAGVDTPNFQNISGGTQYLAWNEPAKPVWQDMYMVFDMDTKRFEKLFSSGLELDLSDIAISDGTVLADYPNGLNIINIVQNRAAGTTNKAGIYLDLAFLGFIF